MLVLATTQNDAMHHSSHWSICHARFIVASLPRNAAHTCSYVCSAADGWAKLESLRKTKRWRARRKAVRLASTCAGVSRSSASITSLKRVSALRGETKTPSWQ
eukprot:scaffold10138_cov61-Phaeocystis_antarctica.AAC.1